MMNEFETPEILVNEPENLEPEVEATPEKNVVFGVVSNCVKLNVRSEPYRYSDIITTIPVDTEVEIDLDDSTDEWYSICTSSGIEGYCMEQYVTILP